jgi:hypothetical protein
MHKGVILLIVAEDGEDAKDKAGSFMGEYQNEVWDWYVIGGRWSGTLSRCQFDKDKLERLEKEFDEKHGWYTGGEEGKTEEQQREAYRKMFTEYFPNWQGKIPAPLGWRDSYATEGYSDDVMPLGDCIEVVKEWVQDCKAESEQMLQNYQKYYVEKDGENQHMKGFYMKRAGQLLLENFCFDTNVFNTESYNYSIPDGYAGWWAVVVDMHN